MADFFKRYFVQLFYSIPGVFIASIPFRLLLSMLRLDSDHQPGGFAGFEELVTVFAGVSAGLGIARYYPRWVSSGCWVGVLPALLLLNKLRTFLRSWTNLLYSSRRSSSSGMRNIAEG